MRGEPLLAWSLFSTTIYFVTLCLLVILRKQWAEHERLLFPLATLPLQMSTQQEDRWLPAFLRNPLMWIGFLIPAAINSINALHAYFNFIPRLNLNVSLSILRDSVSLNFTPRFEVIGLSYLLSLDVAFGVWFFAFLAHLQTGLERMMGWSIGPIQPFSDPGTPSVAHLALGALFFLVGASFWNGRQHLRDVLHKAFRGDRHVDDSTELLSYRTAVFGTFLGSLLALAWHHFSDRPSLCSGSGAGPGFDGQCPRLLSGGTGRSGYSRSELCLGGRRKDFCHGFGCHRTEDSRGRAPRISPSVLGNHGGHHRQPHRFDLVRRCASLYLWRN